jgi:polyvinyl alcohol dehydrogenase (cytochrome)
MDRRNILLTVFLIAAAAGVPLRAQQPNGQEALDVFKSNCATCHDTGPDSRGPSRDVLRQMSPEQIFTALDKGAMARQGSQISLAEKRLLSEYLSEKRFNNIPPSPIAATAFCKESDSPFQDSLAGPSWNGWGPGTSNMRFQPAAAAGLTPDGVSHLKLRWAFGFPGESTASSQPVVVGGRLYVGSVAGNVYSLDAKTGCIHWVFEAKSGVRGAITIGKGPGGALAAFFGDLQTNVYAVNAKTGKRLWQVRVDDHPITRITGSPTLFEGTLYVPIASREESQPGNPKYECCTARGAVAALNVNTGKQLWKTYIIADEPRPIGKNPEGTQMYGPAGGGVWNSPTVDAKLHRIYVGTGNNYSGPAAKTTDAVVAFDMKTGKIVWARQSTQDDIWNGSCLGRSPNHANCPHLESPDFDYGSSAILVTLSNGRRMIVAAQKSGVAHGFDPDKQGEVLWNTALGHGGFDEGVIWGPAADSEKMYLALDSAAGHEPKEGGIFALDLATGKQIWGTRAPSCGDRKPCNPSQTAAVSVIPGAVFSGSNDGHMRAYSTVDGRVLWDFDTVRDFETVNGIPAKGGSISGGGVAVVGGMVFTNSGYSHHAGVIPGNVLLAFSAE